MAHIAAAVRRRQIIEAAAEVIAEGGVAGATTRHIAQQAGVSLATLHYVFPTKEDILTGVLEMLLERARTDLGRAAALEMEGEGAAHGGPVDVFGRLARTYWEIIQRDLATQRVQFELSMYALRTPRAAHLGEVLNQYYVTAAEELIRAGYQRIGMRVHQSLSDLAHLFVAGLDGILLQDLLRPDPARARRNLDNLVQALTALAVGYGMVEGAPGAGTAS